MNDQTNRAGSIAFITYKHRKCAKDCFDKVEIKLGDGDVSYVEYYFPKFTEQMLKKLHPRLRKYIRSIQKGENTFDPIEFKQIEDDLLNSENYEKKFIYSNTPDYNKQQRLIQKAKNAAKQKRLQDQLLQGQITLDQVNQGLYQSTNCSNFNNEIVGGQNYSNDNYMQQSVDHSM